MKISFKTKEESNEEYRASFLALSGIERIHAFVDLMIYSKELPTKAKLAKSDNFVIELSVKNR